MNALLLVVQWIRNFASLRPVGAALGVPYMARVIWSTVLNREFKPMAIWNDQNDQPESTKFLPMATWTLE